MRSEPGQAARTSRRRIRWVLVGLLVGLIGLLSAPSAGAQQADLPNLPSDLQQYVPGSQAWESSLWMTSPPCASRGGDFSIWASSVITDTPSLLAYFQPKQFGPSPAQPEYKPLFDAILSGYKQLTTEIAPILPAGYCVDEMTRWTTIDVSSKPFGFPWGVTKELGHQSQFSCRADAADRNTRQEQEYNHYIGAERAMCDGFYVDCTNAPEAEKARCEAWNTFSDEYVRRVEKLRYKAINEHPAQLNGETETKIKTPGELIGEVAGGWFADLTKVIATGAAKIMAEAMTFWTRADRTAMLQSPAIANIQSLLRYVGIVLLVGSMIWQGIVMMYKRKLDPLISTGMGLLSFVGWSTLGGTLAILINEAGIALAAQVLDDSITTFSQAVGDSLIGQVGVSTGATFFLSIILFLLGVVQWILGFFRQGALVILLSLLPTAAAGQLNEATKPWLKKVLSWCLSLLLYQPIAAIIFAVGLQLMGSGKDLASVLVGMAVVALAVISMPAMLRFFDWGGQKLVNSGGGGGGAMAVGAAASALGGGGAASFSKFMDQNGPGGGPQKQGSGAPLVNPAHTGDGPGGPGEQPGSEQPGAPGGPDTSQAPGGSGPGGDTGRSSGAEGGTDPTNAATGAVGAEAGVGAATGAGASGTGASGAGAGGTAAAGGTAGAAAAGPAAPAVAGAMAAKDAVVGPAGAAAGAATGAMTDGAGE